MGPAEITGFLSSLAKDRGVSAATQNQAKAALLFLYKYVLAMELPWLDEVIQAKVARKLPVVLTSGEVRALLDQMAGTTGLIARLLYGTGMRLLEGLRVRVKDLESERGEVIAREGRITPSATPSRRRRRSSGSRCSGRDARTAPGGSRPR